MPTLAVTMIVKNETRVLPRCFESLVDHIDYWNIHDTGSTDGTPEYIEKYFKKKNIPGRLYHTPWKDFGYNRTQAVRTCRGKADYTLLCDADFTLIVEDKNFKDKMTADGYLIAYTGGLDYRQTLLVNTKFNWEYIGVTHEYIHCPEVKNVRAFDGFKFHHAADGGSRGDKFERDIALLTQGIREAPDNQRYYFYLAQSYKDIGKFDEAIPYYQKRIDFGGWGEEVYYSMYQMGLCKMRRNDSLWEFMGDLLRGYFYRPQRLESLYHLVRYCRFNKMALLGYQLGKMAVNNEYPKDLLFIEKPIHDWLFLDEVAMCAFMCGKFKKACALGKRVLNEQKYTSEGEKTRLENNLNFYKKGYEQWLKNGKNLNMPANMNGVRGNNISGVAAPRAITNQSGGQLTTGDQDPSVTITMDAITSQEQEQIQNHLRTAPVATEITVVLYINQLRPTLEKQLAAILKQSVQPAQLWITISNQVTLSDQLTTSLQKFNRLFPKLKALKIKGDDYDGRLRVISQINTPWVAMYDDNRIPNPLNLAYYQQLVNDPDQTEMCRKAILGQWGWKLHAPKKENGAIVSKWELFPDINQSKFLMTDQRCGRLMKVDYLCGHWFTSKENFYKIAQAHDQKNLKLSRETEDIIFSFQSKLEDDITSYKCCPADEQAGLMYHCGGLQDPINYEMLTQRSDLIKTYCLDGYQMVVTQELSDLESQMVQTSPKDQVTDSKNFFALNGTPVELNQFKHKHMTFSPLVDNKTDKKTTEKTRSDIQQEKKKNEQSIANIFAFNGSPPTMTVDRPNSSQSNNQISKTSSKGPMLRQKVRVIGDSFQNSSVSTTTAQLVHQYRGKRVAFFCPDYQSIGGSEYTIKTLYDRVKQEVMGDEFEGDLETDLGQVMITTSVVELMQFKPTLIITQQRAIGISIQISSQLNIPLWILVHGPGQYRSNSRCQMVIYNSKHLLEFENPPGIQKLVYHPAINLENFKLSTEDQTRALKKKKYFTFIGSTGYNYLKGCDLFIELARTMPEHQFRYVGPIEEIDYQKNYYLVGQMPRLTPDQYNPKDLPSNLTVIANTPNVKELLLDSKLVIIPSLVESFGRVAVEAAQAGVPTVCSGLLGLKESTYGLAEYVEAYRKVSEFQKSIQKVLANYDDYVQKTSEIVTKYEHDQDQSFQQLVDHLKK